MEYQVQSGGTILSMEKFRRTPGPKTGITEDQKVEMHRLHREGNLTVQAIALRFDISTTTLYKYIEEVEARKSEELK